MRRLSLWVVLIVSTCAVCGLAQRRPGGQGGPRPPAPSTFLTEVPAHPVDVILARPTRDSVTVSVLAYQDSQGSLVYGTAPGVYTKRTAARSLAAGKPVEIVLGGLQPGTRYYYRLRWQTSAEAAVQTTPEHTFVTARAPGSTFTFTVTADSHLDARTVPALYEQTLRNARADRPDFHIDLGDTFMTERHPSRDSALRQYLAQRYYFGLLGHSAPLFLALGNHDGETAREQDGTADSVAVWSARMRTRYFPNPVPDRFYTGSATPHPVAGALQDYYAWEWGDALFIVLDPFWFTPRPRGPDDNWSRTLGSEQYQWLKRTLEKSRAPFRFVFLHHLVGGLDKDARGGVEAARLYEWGGRNTDGSDGFAQHRPGWELPLHQLLVKHHVSAVFHGHDHCFVRQELDGVIYQEVPQPGWAGRFDGQRVAEYGYATGAILSSSGHLRITVSPGRATVAYVASVMPSEETADRETGSVVHTYALAAAGRDAPAD